MREGYGQAAAFQSINVRAWASKVRVACLPTPYHAGPSGLQRAHDLIALLASSDYIGRRVLWNQWHSRSHLLTLLHSVNSFREHGGNVTEIVHPLAKEDGQSWSPKALEKIKAGFQKQATIFILGFSRPNF